MCNNISVDSLRLFLWCLTILLLTIWAKCGITCWSVRDGFVKSYTMGRLLANQGEISWTGVGGCMCLHTLWFGVCTSLAVFFGLLIPETSDITNELWWDYCADFWTAEFCCTIFCTDFRKLSRWFSADFVRRFGTSRMHGSEETEDRGNSREKICSVSMTNEAWLHCDANASLLPEANRMSPQLNAWERHRSLH